MAPTKKAPVKKAAAAKKAPAKAPAKKAPAPAKKAPVAKKAAAPAKKAPAAKQAPPKVVRPPALARKTTVKKAPPPRKGPLDKFLLDQLATLEQERETYTRQAASLKAEADLLAAEREPGDVQFDEESGEGDTLAVERERDLALSAQASAAVEEIDLAMAKIKAGTYGVCEQCNGTIPKERLRALPHAALCVQCKSAGFAGRR
jgi:RNA polymerase-binding transcription factor DksA